MFDRGAITIADNHELMFANGKVPDSMMRRVNPERRLLSPSCPDEALHRMLLRSHLKNVFKG
jgi:hypothetical protein